MRFQILILGRSHRKRKKELTMKCVLLCEQPLDLGISRDVTWSSMLKGWSVRGGEGRKEAMPASGYMSSCSLL